MFHVTFLTYTRDSLLKMELPPSPTPPTPQNKHGMFLPSDTFFSSPDTLYSGTRCSSRLEMSPMMNE